MKVGESRLGESGLPLAAVILAAGGSSRFGSPKQLHRLDGRSLVRRAADVALSSGCDPVVAVVGASASDVTGELTGTATRIVHNPDWPTGMASSIIAGVGYLRDAAPACEAAMLLLADQYRVTEDLLRQLAERFRRGPELVAACRYGGILGPPAIFSARLFDWLMSLSGDEGARSLLRSGELTVAEIDFTEGTLDIDTPRQAR